MTQVAFVEIGLVVAVAAAIVACSTATPRSECPGCAVCDGVVGGTSMCGDDGIDSSQWAPTGEAGELDGSQGETDASSPPSGDDNVAPDVGPRVGPGGCRRLFCGEPGASCGVFRDPCGESRDCGACLFAAFDSLELDAADLIWHDGQERIYVSVGPASPALGNSVVAVIPEEISIDVQIPVGADPEPLALSDDGSRLYVGLTGSQTIQTIDLVSLATGEAFSLGLDGDTALHAADISVVPGASDTIVVATRRGRGSGVIAVFDHGVRRRVVRPTFDSALPLEVGDATVAYGQSDDEFVEFPLGDDGVGERIVTAGVFLGYTRELVWDGELLVSAYGAAVDPRLRRRAGEFDLADAWMRPLVGESVVSEPDRNRVYFLAREDFFDGPDRIVSFDRTTYTLVGTLPLPELETGRAADRTRLIRWGGDGFAYLHTDRADGKTHVAILRTNLVPLGDAPTDVENVA